MEVVANLNMNGSSTDPEKWVKHYSSKHEILLVGEGDFSFAACLAKAFGNAANITATSLDSRDELVMKYSRARFNMELLEGGGSTILHGVDATTMNLEFPLCLKSFDRIVYNFPHSGFIFQEKDHSQIQLHRNLVKGFLGSASKLMKVNGEIHITHKTAHPFDKWEIVNLASEVGLCLVGKVPFYAWNYPGYDNKRGSGHRCDESFPVGQCSTFKFAK